MNSLSLVPWVSFKELFSIDYHSIEEAVDDRPGHYKNLDPQALYTSLEDFYRIMTSPYCSGTWVDLGAGVGESVLMYGSLFPERKAVAIERAYSRVVAGNTVRERLGLTNTEIQEGDLLSCEIPTADTYFLYFPTGHILDRVLVELRKIDFNSLIVIESHGDLLPRLMKENWLQPIGEIVLSSARHFPSAVVFSKVPATFQKSLHDVSFKQCCLFIKDDENSEWIGESFELEWLKDDVFHLNIPPRTIQEKDVIRIVGREELSPKLRLMMDIRRKGEVEIKVANRMFRGFIRKILVKPAFRLELSSGEWIQWEDIQSISASDKICYESSLA